MGEVLVHLGVQGSQSLSWKGPLSTRWTVV